MKAIHIRVFDEDVPKLIEMQKTECRPSMRNCCVRIFQQYFSHPVLHIPMYHEPTAYGASFVIWVTEDDYDRWQVMVKEEVRTTSYLSACIIHDYFYGL